MWFTIFCIILVNLFSEGDAGEESCTLAAKGNPLFPKDFSFGVATSAYQIEGSWNADGKGPSIWDDFVHNSPKKIKDLSTGDIAADSYRRFDQDLKALIDLKVKHYRFSIAWSRIFPNGDVSSKNQKGIDYYNDVINKLVKNGIEPVVTMTHFDIPKEIQKIGGFTNSLFVEQFVNYATELFQSFGDRVKIWITFNEPMVYCKLGYAEAIFPPQIDSHGVADYLCLTNTLKAHAAAYRVYRSQFFEKQNGKIGISLNTAFFFTEMNDTQPIKRSIEFHLGIMAHPIFSETGGYPEVMVKDIASNSLKEGRIKSRLPDLEEGNWKELIKGSADFLAINYYTSRIMECGNKFVGENPSFQRDLDCEEHISPDWIRAKSNWLYCVPSGLENLLKYIRDEYNNIEVKISENGWSDEGELEDFGRIRYMKAHLQAVLNAINDGCNVTGYYAWSLIDNFEWNNGYTEKFGLYSVNMKSAKRERIPKKSAEYYKRIIETRQIPDDI